MSFTRMQVMVVFERSLVLSDVGVGVRIIFVLLFRARIIRLPSSYVAFLVCCLSLSSCLECFSFSLL